MVDHPERLVVCVGPSPQSLNLLHAAKSLASRLNAELIAVYVETPGALPAADRNRVMQTMHLAERLGAEIVTLTGDNVSDVVARYARQINAAKIVVGKPLRRSWSDRLFGSVVDRLARGSGEIDVYVVKGVETEPAGSEPAPATRTPWRSYGAAVLIVVLCTLISWGLHHLLRPINLVMIYLAGVVYVATRFGRGPSILASLLSVASFDVFFVPPYLTFVVADAEYLLTFATMLAVALVVSTLAARVRRQADSALRREERTSALYSLSRELAGTQGTPELAAVIRRHIERVFQGRSTIYLALAGGAVEPVGPAGPEDRSVAQWAYDHNQRAGLGTAARPEAPSLHLPMATGDRVVGVIGFRPTDPLSLTPDQMRLLETFAVQAAVALERDTLTRHAADSQVQMEAEKLRNTLLSSISHDLRTPLAAIKGSTSLLLHSPELEPMVRLDMIRGIHDEVDYVTRMVNNLLDLTRLDSATPGIKKEPLPLEELIGTAADHLSKELQDHPLDIHLPADLPMIPMEGVLVQSVLCNLLDNAGKHTASQTPIRIDASAGSDEVTITVSDRGPGVKPGDERKIFDAFYRTTVEGRRAGMGLGLALCEAIVRLHGGRIWVENRPEGGAAFRFTLPL